MPVFIIDKLKPKNNGVFKLMDTLDINHKGYELEDWLDALESKLNEFVEQNPGSGKLVEMENQNGHIMWKYTDEDEDAWRELIDLSNIGGGGISSSEIYVGPTEPEDDSIKMWVDTSDDEEDEGVIEIPTKTSELENDMEFVRLEELKSKLKMMKSDNKIILMYDNVAMSEVEL